jgi:hypothetical protein
MIGYVYLDYDGNLNLKDAEYIDTENPFFWVDNAGTIEKWWRYDTSEKSLMRMILLQLKDYGVKADAILQFRAQIGVPVKRKTEEN